MFQGDLGHKLFSLLLRSHLSQSQSSKHSILGNAQDKCYYYCKSEKYVLEYENIYIVLYTVLLVTYIHTLYGVC